MKKIHLSLVAAAMAIAATAFTTTKTATTTFLYKNDQQQWQQVPSSIDVESECPAGTVEQCMLLVDGKQRAIFNPDHSPYLRD